MPKKIESSLSIAQHGFRANRSVSTNLLNLSTAVHDAFNRRNLVDIFYGDFKTAFDSVSHSILVAKFDKFDIGRKPAKWLYEFVIERTNYVRIVDAES